MDLLSAYCIERACIVNKTEEYSDVKANLIAFGVFVLSTPIHMDKFVWYVLNVIYPFVF